MNDRAARPTLDDVARLAGVSKSTASRSLSNPGRVNATTRALVQDAAQRVGYIGNPHARALSSGRTKAIAVVVSDVVNPFALSVLRGTQQQLRAGGYAQILIDTEESSGLEFELVQALRPSFDGVVLCSPRMTNPQLAQINAEMPVVAINRATKGVPCITMDFPDGVRRAVEHLVSLGHTDIVYAAGPANAWSNPYRWRAIESAARSHGITARRIGPFPPRREAGAAAADAVLNTGATACIAFNDLLAIGMLGRFLERGVRVPDDVSVVGCDDVFGSDFCQPPLTTISTPIEQAGRMAVSMLLSMLGGLPGGGTSDGSAALRGEKPGSLILATHLTVRSSTGPAPAGGQLTA